MTFIRKLMNRNREVTAARRVCEQLAETAAKARRPPPRNWTQAPTDESGLTPAMREMIARREEGT